MDIHREAMMASERAIDIDTLADFDAAEARLKGDA